VETPLIRRYSPADRPQVVKLWQAVFPDNPPHSAPEITLDLKEAYQPELFFVADDGGEIVGTIMAGYDGHRGWLYTVAVRPDRRHQGLGRRLVAYAEQALATLGCVKINLQVRSANAAVVAFYEKLGYFTEERISMAKRL
jgi:ribosomal protein S18 acetylase RimI-like enzyme